jgi:hypothetical protein
MIDVTPVLIEQALHVEARVWGGVDANPLSAVVSSGCVGYSGTHDRVRLVVNVKPSD